MTKTPSTAAPPTAEPLRRAVIYLRVSTERQTKTDLDSDDGYSIKAQRDACVRRARDLGAVVLAEYADKGESAKTRDRTQFQNMVDEVVRLGDVDYVIVHKLDRFAANRIDDALMTLALQQAGAQLVSCTEAIDGTPSGALLHGIMASIAEFYSRNLATEVIKGMNQKALTGGTPNRAPLGYRNVGVISTEGREVRTVIEDPERGPLIAWAFTAYATGQ
nr:recombinase family protein [Pseudomonadota bacterium]